MHFRFARHTNNLEKIKSFYVDVLGLEVLGQFKDHANYDGVFIGKPGLGWHLEFTKSNELVEFHFNEDDLLVFYPESLGEYDLLLKKLKEKKQAPIAAKNPYWNDNALQFLDPDGFRIVISNEKIKL